MTGDPGHFIALRFEVPTDEVDAAVIAAHHLGVHGAEVREPGDPGPGSGPADGCVQLGFWVSPSHDIDAFTAVLSDRAQAVLCGREAVDASTWLGDLRDEAVRYHVGERLWIASPGASVEVEDAVVVHIEPGWAFGTGLHATTRLCAGLVEIALNERSGATVLDVGCGTGVLGIGAARLGARRIVGVDIDVAAIDAARAHARLNGVEDRTVFSVDWPPTDERFDLVLANIERDVVVSMAAQLAGYAASGGGLILSGLRQSDYTDIDDAYGHHGWRCVEARTEEGWSALWLARRESTPAAAEV